MLIFVIQLTTYVDNRAVFADHLVPSRQVPGQLLQRLRLVRLLHHLKLVLALQLPEQDLHRLGVRVLGKQLGHVLVGQGLTDVHLVLGHALHLLVEGGLVALGLLDVVRLRASLGDHELHELLNRRVDRLRLGLLVAEQDRNFEQAVRLLANADEVLQEWGGGDLGGHQRLPCWEGLALLVEGWVY